MEALVNGWATWVEDTVTRVSIRCHLSQLFVYPASFQSAKFWKARNVQSKTGSNSSLVICQDWVLVDREGVQLRMVTDPALGTLFRMEGTYVEITSVMKLSQCGYKVLVVCSWTEAESFPLGFKTELKPPNYADQDKPLCNPSSDLLWPWTAAHLLWSEESPLKLRYSLQSLKLEHDFSSQNLRLLDQTWTSVRRPPVLVVRVLAKCRERLVLQQDNPRKSWMCLTNLLVADNSAYSVLTVWDEAVAAVHGRVREGDLLVLAGGYTPASMRPAHRRLIHNLGPKVRDPRGLPLSPTEIELKLNHGDLSRVHLVHPGATCPSVPPLLCNFVSVSGLVTGAAAAGRLVDLVAVVTWHGRWEREAVSWAPDSGQHWVRLWLQAADLPDPGAPLVSVKVFADTESWPQLEAALPGEVVILTNLVSVFEEARFSHLETSNQTAVFTGEAATDSRFGHQQTVAKFRDSLETNLSGWAELLRARGGLGGHFWHGPTVIRNVTVLDSMSEITRADHLADVLSKLALRATKRLLIKAEIRGVTTYQVEQSGNVSLIEVNTPEYQDHQNNEVTISFGEEEPNSDSFRKVLINLNDKQKVLSAAGQCCFLNLGVSAAAAATLTRETVTSVASLVMEDCRVFAIAECGALAAIQQEAGAAHFMLDCFRSRHPDTAQSRLGDGVEFVLRQAAVVVTDSQEITDESSLLSDTRDLANAFK